MNEPANTRHEIEIVNGGGAVPSAVQTATEHWLEANQRAVDPWPDLAHRHRLVDGEGWKCTLRLSPLVAKTSTEDK